MITVPEAAKRLHKNPETIRRWIREGKLRSTKVGTQHLIEEGDLDEYTGEEPKQLPAAPGYGTTFWGEPMPNVVKWVWESRRGR
ncbi:MAG TPA: helix-turn-helix domain-containing protein [Chloroflexota bacterium]|jgi:excisionase family DNA binding protein|nr:helix-turn-helix domain-containing protein [Chloroflexota bacterium]